MTMDHPNDQMLDGPHDAKIHDDTLAVGGCCTYHMQIEDLGKDLNLGFMMVKWTQRFDADRGR